MMFELIYQYCDVIADRTLANGHRAVFFREDGFGTVQTDIEDEGEYIAFSCNSLEEFEDALTTLW